MSEATLIAQLQQLDQESNPLMAVPASEDRLHEVPSTRAQWLAYLKAPWKRPVNGKVLAQLREGLSHIKKRKS